MTTKISRRSLLATSAAGAAALAAPTLVKAQASEYIIGASLPLTGPFATAGKLVAPALTLFEALTNAAGGIGGTPVRMVAEDSG